MVAAEVLKDLPKELVAPPPSKKRKEKDNEIKHLSLV
jgi:hypothetical protein